MITVLIILEEGNKVDTIFTEFCHPIPPISKPDVLLCIRLPLWESRVPTCKHTAETLVRCGGSVVSQHAQHVHTLAGCWRTGGRGQLGVAVVVLPLSSPHGGGGGRGRAPGISSSAGRPRRAHPGRVGVALGPGGRAGLRPGGLGGSGGARGLPDTTAASYGLEALPGGTVGRHGWGGGVVTRERKYFSHGKSWALLTHL